MTANDQGPDDETSPAPGPRFVPGANHLQLMHLRHLTWWLGQGTADQDASSAACLEAATHLKRCWTLPAPPGESN